MLPKGFKFSKEIRYKMSLSHIGKNTWTKGRKNGPQSLETKKKIGAANALKMKELWQNPVYRKKMSEVHIGKLTGESHPRWKGGLKTRGKVTLLASEYRFWRTAVYKRDSYKCRIFNKDCEGQLEAHHILNWIDYPKLRFEINNGITLCQAHHPRGRAKEKQLEPIFKELVLASKEFSSL